MAIEAVLSPPEGVSREEMDRIGKVIKDANQNRKGSRQALVKLLDEYPELAKLGGSLAEKAEKKILETVTGGNVLVDETTRRQLEGLRQELARPGDGGLERLLTERAVLCWLSLHSAEVARADKWQKGMSVEAADHWDRHVSKLNGDFLKVCKTLAMVRRLLLPTIGQLNISEQAVNVANVGKDAQEKQ